MYRKVIKIFLRLAIALGFLSAVADRLGMWDEKVSFWGNWDAFVHYTQNILPWLPDNLVSVAAILATAAEVVFAIFLLIGFKTELFAKLSGMLLLLFALTMTFSTGIKSAFDASVYAAASAAFALGLIKVKFLEVDILIFKRSTRNKYHFRGFKY